jgi:hypothetical protein
MLTPLRLTNAHCMWSPDGPWEPAPYLYRSISLQAASSGSFCQSDTGNIQVLLDHGKAEVRRFAYESTSGEAPARVMTRADVWG